LIECRVKHELQNLVWILLNLKYEQCEISNCWFELRSNGFLMPFSSMYSTEKVFLLKITLPGDFSQCCHRILLWMLVKNQHCIEIHR
jgi:hypothetical protein